MEVRTGLAGLNDIQPFSPFKTGESSITAAVVSAAGFLDRLSGIGAGTEFTSAPAHLDNADGTFQESVQNHRLSKHDLCHGYCGISANGS